MTWNAVRTNTAFSWMDSKIDLDVKDVTIVEAMKKILERAKVGYDHTEVTFALPKELKVTAKAKSITVRDAMASVARMGSAIAAVTMENNKATVYLRPHTVAATAPVLFTTSGQNSVSIDTQRRIEQAMAAANDAKRTYNSLTLFGGRASLPDRRVTLDIKSADIRNTLKTILKQTDFDYLLEDDVPEDMKKSFTFENIPIATALDVICESAGIGWTAERANTVSKSVSTPPAASQAPSGDKATPVPSQKEIREVKYIIRVGKKYAGRGFRRTSSNFLNHSLLETPLHAPLDVLTPTPTLTEPEIDVLLPVPLPVVAPPAPPVPPVSNETL